MVKITKIRYVNDYPLRINFKRNGLHYSLQEPDELYEWGVQLRCKEDDNEWKYFYCKDITNFLCGWYYKQGRTYKDFDVEKLEEMVFGNK